MRIRPLAHKAWGILRDEGPKSFLNAVRQYLKHEVFRKSYQARRTDVEHRYELIKDGIDGEGESLLDIGCAEGYLTTQFAEDGYFSLGIDMSVSRLERARKSNPKPTSPQFIYLELNPDNIEKLPEFAVVLLLTVYHHWNDAFGLEASERMLKTLASKSDILLFEPPGWEIDGITVPEEESGSIEDYYQSYLEELFPESVVVNFLGMASYTGGSRSDPIFALRCSDY